MHNCFTLSAYEFKISAKVRDSFTLTACAIEIRNFSNQRVGEHND